VTRTAANKSCNALPFFCLFLFWQDKHLTAERWQPYFPDSMTKEKFKDNLSGAIDSLVSLTRELCSNSLTPKYRSLIRPNTTTINAHLDQEEIRFHNELLLNKDKYMVDKEVIDLLWTNNKVPLWINTSVWESSDRWTTIELVTSRRLRTENEQNKVADQFPPFHIQVPLSPDRVDGEKFDINWRMRKLKKKGLWESIKRIVGK
jgi:hypothetical protein